MAVRTSFQGFGRRGEEKVGEDRRKLPHNLNFEKCRIEKKEKIIIKIYFFLSWSLLMAIFSILWCSEIIWKDFLVWPDIALNGGEGEGFPDSCRQLLA